MSFSQMRKSDLIRCDREGNVLEGGSNRLVNRAAVVIHFAVHEAREDIICVAHSHSIYGRTLASLRIPLLTTTQDACTFYNDCGLLDHFGGIVLEGDEGKDIAEALGKKKAVILANHGLLTCSDSVEATVHWFVTLERLCHTQLVAMAAVGGDMKRIPTIDDEAAKTTYESIGTPRSGWFASKFLFDQIAKATNEEYLA